MVEVGRGLWRSSFPTSVLKDVHREQVAQDHVLPGQPGTFAIDVFAYFSEIFWSRDLLCCFSPVYESRLFS